MHRHVSYISLTSCNRRSDKIGKRGRSEGTVEGNGAGSVRSQQWSDSVYDVRGTEAVEDRSEDRRGSGRRWQESRSSFVSFRPPQSSSMSCLPEVMLIFFLSAEQSGVHSHVRIVEIGRDRDNVSVPSHSVSHTGMSHSSRPSHSSPHSRDGAMTLADFSLPFLRSVSAAVARHRTVHIDSVMHCADVSLGGAAGILQRSRNERDSNSTRNLRHVRHLRADESCIRSVGYIGSSRAVAWSWPDRCLGCLKFIDLAPSSN